MIHLLIWLRGIAFTVAIELVLWRRLRRTSSTEGTELTITGIATSATELEAYHGGTRSPAHKHARESMGLPQITGTSTVNPIIKVSTVVWR